METSPIGVRKEKMVMLIPPERFPYRHTIAILATFLFTEAVWASPSTILYDGSTLPTDAIPPWQQTGNGNVSTDGDILTISTLTLGNEQQTYYTPNIVDSGTSLIVEARLKVGSTGNNGEIPDTALVIVDSSRAYSLVFLDDRIAAIAEGQMNSNWSDLTDYHMIDTTSDFHTYKMVYGSNQTNIFIDGIHALTTQGYAWSANYVAFGDIRKSTGGMNGSADWDYVRITTVPIPSSLLLVTVGLLSLRGRRSRMRHIG